MQAIWISLLLAVSTFAVAQSSEPAHPTWQMQESGTTASLRGIDSVDGTVAWASGTGGTVLRTIDGGAHWTKCAIPDAITDGATLDFRGVQAFSADTAIVMASGRGNKSRLYKTTDGCTTWKLVFANPDKDGFWDAIQFMYNPRQSPMEGFFNGGVLLGDPVDGKFPVFTTDDLGTTWHPLRLELRHPSDPAGPPIWAKPGEALFAASNTAVTNVADNTQFAFVAGGKGGARLVFPKWHGYWGDVPGGWVTISSIMLPIPSNDTSGAFSIASRRTTSDWNRVDLMIVGGDCKDSKVGVSVFVRHSYLLPYATTSLDSRPKVSTHPPHGYRSAVQWGDALKLWITVGTNGSDISRDDGKTWQPIDDGNWNALSLPFVVGPNGRIARLNPAALSHSTP
jgi:hypothetical protein